MIELCIFPPRLWAWKSHQGSGRRSYNPLYLERKYIQNEVRKQYSGDLLSCPVRVHYQFAFEPPKSVSKKTRMKMLSGEIKHTKKPDCTNLQKFTEDCLNKVVVVDDCQVIGVSSDKFYGEKFCIIIHIHEVPNGT